MALKIRATSKVGISLLALAIVAAQPTGAEERTLTTITEIRNLTATEVVQEFLVQVSGIVTFADEQIATLFIHDGEAGIFIEQPQRASSVWPEPGDRIEVYGATSDGIFSPVISGKGRSNPQITILGKGALPSPRLVDGGELSQPDRDCDWVSVEAEVVEISFQNSSLVFECRAGPCDFHLQIAGPLTPKQIPWDLLKRRVRVHGVVATIFNTNRQMTRRFLRVNSPEDIVAIDPLTTGREARLVSPDQLLRLDGPGPNDLVVINGVVTFNMPGKGLFLRANGGGLWVQTARSKEMEIGSVVRVEGWPREGTMKPFVRASDISVVGKEELPVPLENHPNEFLSSRFESELVACEAELLNTFQGADGTTFELRNGSVVFRGWLDRSDEPPSNLLPGSQLRVTGIAQITTAGAFSPLLEEDKLLLRLRSAADVELIRPPPWWTPQRVFWLFLVVLSMMAIVYQRGRLQRKRKLASQQKSFEAVLAERGRFAREIHDSLAQGLTSVSLQLECIKDRLPDSPVKAREHLETARELIRDSLREARRTVWNLRPLALGEADLASALQKYAQDFTRDTEMSCHQQIEGTPCPLPREHEEALLRIGQEALTNAVRHADPQRIEVRLRFGEGWITLTVKDDGRGFDVADRVKKGYGLTGMHERVDALDGSLSIDSQLNEGTEVSVTLPL